MERARSMSRVNDRFLRTANSLGYLTRLKGSRSNHPAGPGSTSYLFNLCTDVYFQRRHVNGAASRHASQLCGVHKITGRSYTKKRRTFPFVLEENDDL